MTQPVNLNRFLSPEDTARVAAAVTEAEKTTSAEIKVVILTHCWRDIRSKAAQLFLGYGLEKTELRNCVMILLVTTNREFLIYGDKGIHCKVGQGFWDDVRDRMSVLFAEGRHADALCEGVKRAGDKLTQFFPAATGDRNEVSNEVTFAE